MIGFIYKYFSDTDTIFYRVIVLIYFAFTSLTTVGFGDFVPRSDTERVFTAFVIFFGVAVFSYIVGNFVDVLESFNLIQQDFDEGDHLFKFFGLLKNFNSGNKLKKKSLKDIEDYFEYKWQNDKNQAICTNGDIAIMNQMPIDVQCKIYSCFLYKRFLYKYRKFFTFPNM